MQAENSKKLALQLDGKPYQPYQAHRLECPWLDYYFLTQVTRGQNQEANWRTDNPKAPILEGKPNQAHKPERLWFEGEASEFVKCDMVPSSSLVFPSPEGAERILESTKVGAQAVTSARCCFFAFELRCGGFGD